MTLRLWLVRHGATDWSDRGRLNGRTDLPLNARGRRQAAALATRLAGRAWAGVWTSDLRRAAETARLAAPGARAEPRLREIDFGALEGRPWQALERHVREALVAFEGFRAPAGESTEEVRARVLGFLSELAPGDHLVFTHGGVIRALLRTAGSDRRVLPGELVTLPWPARPALASPPGGGA